jgi:sporulation protein YlmC with PRC-barrel domain
MRRRLTDGNMCMGAVVGPSDKKRVEKEAGMDNARERTHVLLMPRDLIHRQIIDSKDEVIGYIRDLLIDEVDWKVRFLHATQGGFLGFDEHHFLIPIEAVRTVTSGFVVIELSKEQVHGGPELDPNIRLHPELRSKIYEHYGYPTPG